ncbi:MAG: C10 family peptidase [Bacteroidales bacterium]|nr:C10 family peptidase [Bacteroidales bacterium]
MKKLFMLFLTLAMVSFTFAGNVSVNEAKRVAKNYLTESYAAQQIEIQLDDIQLSYTEMDENGDPVFYRFDIKNSGFIVVSATDLVAPVLAYSFEGLYKANEASENYLTQYKNQIQAAKASKHASAVAEKEWKHYNVAEFTPRFNRGADYVDPLITTTWNQGAYYNTYCPYDGTISENDQHAVVGCVAVNMSNILNYYRYPEKGIGGVSYYPATVDEEYNYVYPRQQVMFAHYTYNYDAIPRRADWYTGELAKLIYHVGVSARMQYGWGYDNGSVHGSGSNTTRALNGFKQNWGFGPQATIVESKALIVDDDYSRWIDTLKAELKSLRPLYFSAYVAEGVEGHAFLVDGYDADGLFHVNWGWEGSGNGFYRMDYLLDPMGDGGTSYNTDQSAIFNLYPKDQQAKPTSGSVRNTATRGCVTDGAGNLSYENNTEREWILAAPNAKAYTFNFAKLKTQTDKDVITFYNAATGTKVAGPYSGHYLNIASGDVYKNYEGTINRPEGVFPDGQLLPEEFKVLCDSVRVVFTTDADSVDNGFVLYFEADLASSPSCYPTPGGFLTAAEGVLKDKNEDGSYVGEKACAWRVKPSNSLGLTKLTFAFNKFDLREGDFVEIFDMSNGEKPARFARYDIYNMPEGAFTCNFTDIKVVFVSDNWLEGEGFELQYGGTTEINENLNAVDVNIYPNPAKSFINVALNSQIDQQLALTIVDLTGKVVYAEKIAHNAGESTYRFPVDNLSKGFYFLRVETNEGKTIRKFVVE